MTNKVKSFKCPNCGTTDMHDMDEYDLWTLWETDMHSVLHGILNELRSIKDTIKEKRQA